MVKQCGCCPRGVLPRSVVDPIGLRGMLPERPRPSLRILVAGTARKATLCSKACQTSRPHHVDQAQSLLKANLGQCHILQLGTRHKARFQGATTDRFHERAVFVAAKVKDAESALGRVPSATFAAAKENRRFADSATPAPEICRRGVMYQRLSVVQVGRRWIEHQVNYSGCSP